MKDIKSFEKQVFEKWITFIPLEISKNLKKPIIERKNDNPNLIILNFDPGVRILLNLLLVKLSNYICFS